MKNLLIISIATLAGCVIFSCGMDADGDGEPDLIDQCPADPTKIEPGQCGCGIPEGTCSDNVDSDGDGEPDSSDQCPTDPNKTIPGQCGCDTDDDDTDADGVANCRDNCPDEFNPNQVDENQNGVGDLCEQTVENKKPVVKFIQPSSKKVPADLGVVVEATDPDGTIVKVVLWLNGTIVATDDQAPYRFGTANTDAPDSAMIGLAPGQYELRAVATDDEGAKSDATLAVQVEETEQAKPGSDLEDGVYFGYQGWHFAKGDGRLAHPDIKADDWIHWFENNKSNFANIHGDFWPDFTDYKKANVPLYNTQMKYPNGETVKVYSCWDYETVDLHIRWLADYGLKGIFFQRQSRTIDVPSQRALFDRVALHVWKACEKYKIKFAMMPCNNYKDQPGDDIVAWRQRLVKNIINDWKYLVDDLRLPNKPNYSMIDSPMYAYQKDRKGISRPVIGLWGLGQDNRPMTAQDASQILAALHNNDRYHVYIMAGVPTNWRTDPKSAAWVNVYKNFDMISPWRTIFSMKDEQIKTMNDDIAYCHDKGMDYNAVVSAGASSRHMRDKPDNRNLKPRLAGQFFWDQVFEVVKAYDNFEVSRGLPNRSVPRFLYLAMVDEIDEGTALYKQAEIKAHLPVNSTGDPTNALVPLNEDGVHLDADFYLRLSKAAQDMLDDTLRPTKKIPIALER